MCGCLAREKTDLTSVLFSLNLLRQTKCIVSSTGPVSVIFVHILLFTHDSQDTELPFSLPSSTPFLSLEGGLCMRRVESSEVKGARWGQFTKEHFISL